MRVQLIIWLLCLVSISAFAQKPDRPNKELREKIEAQRVSFLTSKLQLTTDEAQKFWPIYNAHQKEMKTLRKTYRPKKGRNLDEMSDAEIETMLSNRFTMKEKALKLEKAYHVKLKKAIPVRKIATLERAEEEFKKKLFKQLRQHKKENRG